MDYIVKSQRIDTEKKQITFFLCDENEKYIQITSKELKQKIGEKEINVLNFKLEKGKLKYVKGFFKPKRTLTDQQTPEDRYIVANLRDNYTLYSRDGKKIKISKGDFEHLARVGKLLNAHVFEDISFSKLKLEDADEFCPEPYLVHDDSVEVTKENFNEIKGIIQIYYNSGVSIKDKWYRTRGRDGLMEARKFWSIIKSFNHGKMDYTAEDIKKYADEIADKFFIYSWFNMTDDEFAQFNNALRDFEGTIYSHECLTREKKRFFEVIPESDDGFRQTMCTFLWLYGEQGCKEFIQDPSGTIKKYNVPVDELTHCYIYGY